MHDELLTAALAYAARGYAVFPLTRGAKVPAISKEKGGRGALDATTDPAQIRAWWAEYPGSNIGITAGASGLLLVDVDNKNGRDGFTAWETLRALRPFDDTTPHVWTPNRGKHLYFAAPPGVRLRNTDDELGPGIETKANGKYCVAPPSRLADGRCYHWDERLNLDNVQVAPAPAPLCELLGERTRPARKVQPVNATGDLATVQDALRCLDPWAGGYDWWVRILMAIHSEFPGADGLAVADAWAAGKEGEVAAKWHGFKAGGGITLGTLYDEAKRRGWRPPWEERRNGIVASSCAPDLAKSPKGPEFIPTETPSLSDDKLAARLDSAPRLPAKNNRRTVRSADLVDFLQREGYSFRLNLCNDSLEVNGERMTDVIRADIRCKLRDAGYGKFLAAAEDAYTAHAAQHSYHPVREYLSRLTWDGCFHVSRLASYVTDAHGVFGTHLRKWLIGSIARAYEETQNAMLVWDGPQGVGKSQLARWLCPMPALFEEGSINPDNKDDALKAMATWVWEVSELGATLKRADVEALKSFLSRKVFIVRPPYGHYDIRKPALASFIGTVNNSSGVFNDPTGSRRYMTTTITAIDWQYTQNVDVTQVWAEALAAYQAGESWMLFGEEAQDAAAINETYNAPDPVEDLLKKFYHVDPQDVSNWTSSADLLTTLQAGGLGMKPTANAMLIAATLKRLGCQKHKMDDVRGYLGLKLR